MTEMSLEASLERADQCAAFYLTRCLKRPF